MINPHRLLEQRSPFLAQPCGYADVAQLVERWLPKPKVAGSRPVVRSSIGRHIAGAQLTGGGVPSALVASH